ncbi:hypothetical protein EAX61_07495 [Dokdonia sinensis]|uniref:Polysaccharide pyruvyl transferase domain-containing protein n=1 Tax=Dokdonia sinensis TaxID=2479847 RepID=A0A3M0GCW2_9FLAO|nr:polysaccharide pyruvyl transferase family protein [Dokdonia sinensis]RMB59423.1 hypothetical protein EAX61_07495 [Dokdonia sinensis]
MAIKKIIGSVFPMLDSARRKEYVVQKVLDKKQQHNDIRNVHVVNPTNVGDYYSGPHHYFDTLKGKSLHLSDFRVVSKSKRDAWADAISENALIVGGGGLLNIRHFKMQMELFQTLAERGKKIVIWGAGHNETNRALWGKVNSYYIDMSAFGLAGTRDYSMKNLYVPCVSCLHTIFDRDFNITHDVGVIFNHNSIKDQNLVSSLSKYPSTSNTSSIEAMVEMIGKCETIVSNSYHAIYWATLLGRKTVAIPTTSKFFDLKHQPIISTFDNFEADLKKAVSYSGVLEESREINRDFYQKTMDYLS